MSTTLAGTMETTLNLQQKTPTPSPQQTNMKRVQELVAEFQKGNPEGYLAGVADDIKGSILGGLLPGAESVCNKEEFAALMGSMEHHMEVKKFEPLNWRAVNDDVLFNVNWTFVWKATGETIDTTALVRKVVRDGLICEKYHMIDGALIERLTGKAAPHSPAPVERVQALLAEYQAGRPEGYMAGVADDIRANVLGGLLPGAERIRTKEGFGALMGSMGAYMEVSKFEPYNFRAMPNSDMIFNVDWTFVWKPTGKTVHTTAICRKVLKEVDGALQICEKYHMVDVDAVVQTSPRDVIDAAEATATAAAPATHAGCTAPGFEDTTFAAFTPARRVEASLPILLFQSGYGSSSSGHQPLMQAIADAGFVCVIPDRAGDTHGGKESVGKLFAGLADGTPASEHNAMSTDGTHLAAALAWVQARDAIDGQPVDGARIAAAGFSMGCLEAIQFAAAAAPDVRAVALISSSSGTMLEKLYCFDQAELARKCAGLACPSLWITSDRDAQRGATTELFDAAAAPAQLLVFHDSALDNSMALTDETSIWSPAVNDMMPGIAQHFALATERRAVSAAPIVAFLDRHLKGAAAAPLAAEADVFEHKEK